MQISKKDIYLVESTSKTDEWTIVYNELRYLGHVVHTVTLSPDENYVSSPLLRISRRGLLNL